MQFISFYSIFLFFFPSNFDKMRWDKIYQKQNNLKFLSFQPFVLYSQIMEQKKV